MAEPPLDEVNRAIIQALQADARGRSSTAIADVVGISDSAVRKRIARLEDAGIIRGYHADVNYQAAGFPLRMLLYCTAPIDQRADKGAQILQIQGVVRVQELLTGDRNLLVTVVGQTDADITSVARSIVELGVTVADEVLVRSTAMTPFDGFEPNG
jgi:DNA-binding Lrp family transcriptional regulator